MVFYDEPFEHLDVEGVAGVMEMLNEIAEGTGTVLVVTHNSAMKTMFEKSLKVIKGEDGYSTVAS
jgi:DNA repair exonuclease SbcCD ATPase subunit